MLGDGERETEEIQTRARAVLYVLGETADDRALRDALGGPDSGRAVLAFRGLTAIGAADGLGELLDFVVERARAGRELSDLAVGDLLWQIRRRGDESLGARLAAEIDPAWRGIDLTDLGGALLALGQPQGVDVLAERRSAESSWHRREAWRELLAWFPELLTSRYEPEHDPAAAAEAFREVRETLATRRGQVRFRARLRRRGEGLLLGAYDLNVEASDLFGRALRGLAERLPPKDGERPPQGSGFAGLLDRVFVRGASADAGEAGRAREDLLALASMIADRLQERSASEDLEVAHPCQRLLDSMVRLSRPVDEEVRDFLLGDPSADRAAEFFVDPVRRDALVRLLLDPGQGSGIPHDLTRRIHRIFEWLEPKPDRRILLETLDARPRRVWHFGRSWRAVRGLIALRCEEDAPRILEYLTGDSAPLFDDTVSLFLAWRRERGDLAARARLLEHFRGAELETGERLDVSSLYLNRLCHSSETESGSLDPVPPAEASEFEATVTGAPPMTG